MSLVAAGLWVVGTILGRLAMRSMQGDESMGLGLTMGDAIAAVSVLASLLLFAYTRTANRDPQRILDLGLVYMVLTALALGLTFHSGPILPDAARLSTDLVDRRSHPDVFGDRTEHQDENASRGPGRGLHESGGDALGSCPGLLGFRPGEQRAADALPRLPARRRRRRHLARRDNARPAGGEGARDGKLSARRTAGARRHGRGLQGVSSNAGEAGRHQVDPAGDARGQRPGRGRACDRALPAGGGGGGAAAVGAYGGPLRLRSDRGSDPLSGDGVPGRNGSRVTGSAAWPDAGAACGSCPSPGL